MAALAQREVIELRIDALLGDVETLIGQLDRLDGDADLEPEDDLGADDEGCGKTWIEVLDQERIAGRSTATIADDDDAEDDDFGEDDDPAGGSADDVGEVDEDLEREQMAGDVPCLPVFALEPSPFDGKRALLGYSGNNVGAFVSGNPVQAA